MERILTAVKPDGKPGYTHSITYTHHYLVSRGSVHLHHDIGALFPCLSHGFMLPSQVRCATYPLSWRKQSPVAVSVEKCPFCPPDQRTRAKETYYDHMIFTCEAWKKQCVQAACYTLALMTRLMHDVLQVNYMKLTCMQRMWECDMGLVDFCVRPYSVKCMSLLFLVNNLAKLGA